MTISREFLDRLGRLRRLRACFKDVGEEARAVLQVEYDRLLEGCPGEERVALAKALTQPTGESVALEWLMKLPAWLNKQIERMHERTEEFESGQIAPFPGFEGAIESAGASQAGRERLVKQLSRFEELVELCVTGSVEVTRQACADLAESVDPGNIASAVESGPGDPPRWAVWRHYRGARCWTHYVRRCAKFRDFESVSAKRIAHTRLLRYISTGLSSADGGGSTASP